VKVIGALQAALYITDSPDGTGLNAVRLETGLTDTWITFGKEGIYSRVWVNKIVIIQIGSANISPSVAAHGREGAAAQDVGDNLFIRKAQAEPC
jgi:hypothetical protein